VISVIRVSSTGRAACGAPAAAWRLRWAVVDGKAAPGQSSSDKTTAYT
jgi:hypothetical protein